MTKMGSPYVCVYGDLEYCSGVGSNCVLCGPLIQVLVSEPIIE